MFRGSPSFLLFDYFRVPWRREPSIEGGALGHVRPAGDGGKALYWPSASVPMAERVAGTYELESIPIFGGVVRDVDVQHWLSRIGGRWRPSASISDRGGVAVASIWSGSDGDVFLPFDPNEVILNYWSEGYVDFLGSPTGRRARAVARRSYYRVRPLVPRASQIAARRWYSWVQSRTSFPRWPVETAMHDLYELLFATIGELVDEPVPMIAPWPAGATWAFVLTHDVETSAGYRDIDLLKDIELQADLRSSWNFVPKNHNAVDDDVLAGLRRQGFEIGVHGLCHDGRDIAEFEARLPAMRDYARQWDAVGFRSPSTLRDWKTMPLLGFEYDSTYSDTAQYEPQPGGCCSWLPYMIEDMVELPITLPQDHTLFEILGGVDEGLWLDKARFIRGRGGMVLVLTHPDYARNEQLLRAYKALLDEFADDATAWKALPREVAAWWGQRAASEVRRKDEDWEVVGPASRQAVVTYATKAA